MKPVDILEWTMGWPWPVIAVLMALTVWGIVRIMMWDEEEAKEPTQSPSVGEPCVCTCDAQ